MSNSAEGGGTLSNPAGMVVVPSTRLEYVVYFLGLGIAAMVLLTVLLP